VLILRLLKGQFTKPIIFDKIKIEFKEIIEIEEEKFRDPLFPFIFILFID